MALVSGLILGGLLGPLNDVGGANGPRLLGIMIQSIVAIAYGSLNFQNAHRSRNAAIRLIRETLATFRFSNVTKGPDRFSWGPPSHRKVDFSTKLT